MSKPVLIILAGCNGAGKSTYSQSLVNEPIIPFDYDKRFKEIYDALPDSEFRERMANNQTTLEFEESINKAFANAQDFCYETNFDANPIYWLQIAKERGYRIELVFFCLKSIEQAKDRVAARTRQHGHFVSDKIISYKWKEGFKNLNLHFECFDHIVLVENSSSLQPLNYLFTLTKKKNKYESVLFTEKLPEYAKRRFPKITELVNNTFR